MRIILFFVLFIFFSLSVFCEEKPLPGQLPRYTRSGGTIFRTLFDRVADVDEDGWPDSWTRKRGVEKNVQFPDYIDIRIVENNSQFGNNALRMSIEGSSAGIFSPKIKIRRGMCYTVSAFVSTENIIFDDVFISAAFYGKIDNTNINNIAVKEPIFSKRSPKIKNTNNWQKIEIGPIHANNDNIDSIAVGLITLQGERRDFNAKVYFTNVEIKESPNVRLSMPNNHHIFTKKTGIEVSCMMTGFDPDQDKIKFTIEDPFGKTIAGREIEMTIGNRPVSQFVVAQNDRWSVFDGAATWQNLPIISPGFYRVRVETPKEYIKNLQLPAGVFFEDPLQNAPPLTFAVIDQSTITPDGAFGWNLDGWSLQEILDRQQQLALSGISKLKIPAWITNDNNEQRRQFLQINETFTPLGMQVIGLLSPVPKNIRDKIRIGKVNAAAIFAISPTVWTEQIQPILQENSLLVKNWQLNADDDLSIVNLPDFENRFQNIRFNFDRKNLGFGLGVAWDWTHPFPFNKNKINNTTPETPQPNNTILNRTNQTAPREFISLYTSDKMTASDLEMNLSALPDKAEEDVRKFISISVLSGDDYELPDRITDIVRKMVIGKTAGIEAFFLTSPISEKHGVLNADATPNELFTPWRTTSVLISGRDYLGQIKLPNRSRNYNFVDHFGGNAIMVIWNDSATDAKPVTETLYLGEEVEVIDVWGRHFVPELEGRNQKIVVGRMPVFVVGLDTNITRMRVGFSLDKTDIPSRTNTETIVPFSFKNDTNLPANIQFSVIEPRINTWQIKTPTPLSLDAGNTGKSEFGITLNSQSNTGLQKFRIDVTTIGAEPRRFAVYDDIYIGEREISMEFSSRMNRSGDIEVTQAFINNGERERSYVCRLRVTGREYLQTFVTRQGFGRIEHKYTIPNGRELIRNGINEITIQATPLPTDTQSQPMLYTIPIID
ncbi:MAG: hypothetical protein LBQ66_07980 [Planctomycetaceae bacterium]|jgi:hypothetical protein|nr:hypothetical protein [Planctomycetaceae bacterium]